MARSRSFALLIAFAIGALAACDTLRAARGCGDVALDASVTVPLPSPGTPLGEEARERRAREVIVARLAVPLEDVVARERMTIPYPTLAIAGHHYKLYRRDGTYLGAVQLDASGAELPENVVLLAQVVAEVRARGKVGDDLSDAVARSLPSDAVPVMFQLVAAPWGGPPAPWPRDIAAEDWNAFVERHADPVYRPIVTPFVEHLRSIGARDIAPDPATATYVKDAWVFARVPSHQVCAAARRPEVLRASHNPPLTGY